MKTMIVLHFYHHIREWILPFFLQFHLATTPFLCLSFSIFLSCFLIFYFLSLPLATRACVNPSLSLVPGTVCVFEWTWP